MRSFEVWYQGQKSLPQASSSMPKIASQLRQFDAPPVQDFLDVMGFDVSRTSMLRFVVIAPGKFDGPSTLSVVVSSESIASAVAAAQGADQRAWDFGRD